MKKYHRGLLVGRFQPFHKGHRWLIKKALLYVDEIIIGLGSANKNDPENPLTCQERKKNITKFFVQEKIKNRLIKIVCLSDVTGNDDLWRQKTLAKTGKIEVVIGNNEWVNGIFERVGYPILRLGFVKRHLWEGTEIRKLKRRGEKWEDRVPKYLVSQIKKHLR